MKLHLGCGKRFIPGEEWVHIDLADYSHIQVRHDIGRLPMIEDKSVELVYACHVLEHFMPKEVEGVLTEWRRVLVSNGKLRVAVPDWDAVKRAAVEQNFGLEALLGLLYGRQDSPFNIHYTIYDFRTLEKTLLAAGYKHVYRYNWRETEHSEVDDYSQAYLPHMKKVTGLPVSLNVEAIAP